MYPIGFDEKKDKIIVYRRFTDGYECFWESNYSKHFFPFQSVVGHEDEGDAEVSSGGSLRYNTGKPQFSHLSPDFIMEMANLMTKSAEKYSRQNWLRKQDIRTAADSLFRHYSAFMSGQDNDEGGSEMSHLLHIAVNAMIMWENYRMYGKEVDNRFYKTIKELMGEN